MNTITIFFLPVGALQNKATQFQIIIIKKLLKLGKFGKLRVVYQPFLYLGLKFHEKIVSIFSTESFLFRDTENMFVHNI